MKFSDNIYSQTSIVRNASDFQLFFELSEFRTYRVGFFCIVGKIRAYKITAYVFREKVWNNFVGSIYLFYEAWKRMKTITVTKII